MPAFVIHAFGHPPRKVVVESSPIRVGRDPTADIVIQEPSVSRDHAMFLADEGGKWLVSCVSDVNPILVDGAIITAGTIAREGTEVLVGTSTMIIFSENAFSANQYMEGKRHFEQGTCDKCKWTGLVSSLSRDPKCPRCAASLKSATTYGSDARHSAEPMDVASRRAAAVGTAQMPLEKAQDMWAAIKAAKLSRLERVDGRDPEKAGVQLAENGSFVIGKDPTAALRLAGFAFGQVVVAWDGSRYVATSALSLASMKVNGKKAKVAKLTSGDVLEVGSNRFRFVTGKGAGELIRDALRATDPVLHEIRAMANLTITVDEETLRRARARALQQGTSVNAILSEHLAHFARLQDVQEGVVGELLDLAAGNRRGGGAKRAKRRGRRTWRRADLHER